MLAPLSVVPTHQPRGVGTRLLEAAVAHANETRPSLRIPEPTFQVAMLSRFEKWMTGRSCLSDGRSPSAEWTRGQGGAISMW